VIDVHDFPHKLRQLGEIDRDPPRFVFGSI
jgi:hypothetical protein